MNRRQFLALGAAVSASVVLDPERLLWVPGARTFFLPSTEIVQAATLADAVSQGFVVVFPDGVRMEIQLGGAGDGRTLDERLARERWDVVALGGRIIENRQWTPTTLTRWGS